MRRQLFTLVTALLMGCTTTVWGQTNLAGRTYYHANIMADIIPGGSTLIFEIELLGIA